MFFVRSAPVWHAAFGFEEDSSKDLTHTYVSILIIFHLPVSFD
ncbi:hypothetical protein BSBH6_00177 [Bacillus subtilis]|nr:hypothetical protein BSBH6_00177 [Bacillus subtilis]RPK26540.1 hypothetical protein BH5_00175 [Bacillus subtilis]